MKSKSGFLLPILFVIAILFTIGNFVYTYNTLTTLQKSETLLNQTHATLAEIEKVSNELLWLETNQRAYIITGNESYVASLDESFEEIAERMGNVKELTKDNRIFQQELSKLELIIDERILRIQEGISIRRDQGFEQAQQFMGGGQGTQLTEDIRGLIQSIEEQETKNLAGREQQTRRNYNTIYTTTLLSNLANFFLIIFVYFSIYKELRQRNEEEKVKDNFINMASHELKTPITSMKIFTHVLKRKLHDGQVSEAKRYITKIDNQTNKLTLLISDLLDLSRIQTGKMRIEKESFNLDALIDETVEEIQGTTKKHDIVVDGHVNRLVKADRYRMYQVLVNLLTNAIKYSPEGGKITVTSELLDKKAIVSVKDSGIGIDTRFQKKIFERLYQVTDPKEKTFPGLGVGLYISSYIMREHKGTLTVESEKGKGSTFSFSLPLDQHAE